MIVNEFKGEASEFFLQNWNFHKWLSCTSDEYPVFLGKQEYWNSY